ncbi:MAG TPA: LysM peptidoglycan-binding domain-containing protein [Anaeromyxobacter sp.]|nr:LysM peptidoglycan-binding domain-containing protein [Anaeromyxobacter sp.]
MRPIRTTVLFLLSTFLAVAARAEPPEAAWLAEVVPAPERPASPAASPTPAAPAAAAAKDAAAAPAREATSAPEAATAPDEVTPDADTPDEPAVAAEIDKESAELEAVRKAEGASRVQEAREPRRHVGIVEELGLESPLRERVDAALGRDVTPRAEGGHIALLPEIDHDLDRLKAEYDIPIEVNEAVVAYIRFFQSPLTRPHFVKWLGRSHRYLERYRQILKEEGVPEDTVFLAMIESGFGNFAYSRARASGPWQFISQTGRLYGLQQDFWVDERRDPERSARAAARYLKKLHEQTGDWRLAWAGYNAGVGRIFNAQKRGYDDFWAMAAAPGRGRKALLRPETKGYVPKLMAAAIITKHPEAFGFKAEEIEAESWTDYAEVTVPNATPLGVLARAAGVAEKDVLDLNPELRRSCTPPRPYQLKLPRQSAATFAENWPAMQDKVRLTFAGHVVHKGDTLSSIATRYGVPTQGILEMNGLKAGRHLRVGQELLVPKPIGSAAQAVARAPAEPRRAEVAPAPRAAAPAPVVTLAEANASSTLKVRAGDTLWSISRKLGVALDDLCRWNGIENPRRHKLLVGAMLVVRPRG